MDKGPSEITPLRIYKKNPVSGHSQIYYFIPVIQNKSMKSQTIFINAAEKYFMINSVTILVSLLSKNNNQETESKRSFISRLIVQAVPYEMS